MLCAFIIFDIYIFILCTKNVKNMLKLYPLRTKQQNKIFCEDENIQFNFIETKIKIRYIYRDEKLI